MKQDDPKSPPPSEAILILVQEGQPGPHWPLGHSPITIGREADNDIVISDRWISRHHAQITWEKGHYILSDLGSKNGLFVNGSPVTEAVQLQDGDTIQIAPRFQLTFVDSEATAPVLQHKTGVQIDHQARRVWVTGVELDPPLSTAQFALLEAMIRSPGRVFTSDELIALAWPDEDPSGVSADALDSLIRRLRGRLMEIDPTYRYIFAVRGHGLKFEPPA